MRFGKIEFVGQVIYIDSFLAWFKCVQCEPRRLRKELGKRVECLTDVSSKNKTACVKAIDIVVSRESSMSANDETLIETKSAAVPKIVAEQTFTEIKNCVDDWNVIVVVLIQYLTSVEMLRSRISGTKLCRSERGLKQSVSFKIEYKPIGL